MRSKVLIAILAALAFLVGAYLLLGERQSPPAESVSGQRLFPELEQKLNDIDRIRVEARGSVYEVVRKGDQWQLVDKGGYPVLFERVKPLLLGIALLEKVEPKTDKAENYARLGVQEPSADTRNTRLALYAADGVPVASLIIGMVRQGLIAGGRDGVYARVSGEPRAWLLAGNLELPQTQVDWVDRQIINIKPKTVKRVIIRQADGGSLVIQRLHQGSPDFAVTNMPAGSILQEGIKLNPLAMTLAGLNMEDVLVRSQAGLPEAEAVAAVFETWDGLQVTAYTVEQADKIFAWFAVAELDVTDLSKVRTLQRDDAALRSRLEGWVYQIPRSRGDQLRTRLDGMLQSPGAVLSRQR